MNWFKGIKLAQSEKYDMESVLPHFLYHATYKKYYSSIMKKGLLPNNTIYNWGECDYGVFLSDDPHIAASFAEEPETPQSSEDEPILILKINVNMLDKDKFAVYPHIIMGDIKPYSFVYEGIIPFSAVNNIERYN